MSVLRYRAKQWSIPKEHMDAGRFYMRLYVNTLQIRDIMGFTWYFSHERQWLLENNIEHSYYGSNADLENPEFEVLIPSRKRNRVAFTKALFTLNAVVKDDTIPRTSWDRKRHKIAADAYDSIMDKNGVAAFKHMLHVNALGRTCAGRDRIEKARR